jgi:hypothetical protein
MAPGTLRISSQFGARDGGFAAREKGKCYTCGHWIVVHGNLLTTCLKSKDLICRLQACQRSTFRQAQVSVMSPFWATTTGMRPSMLVQEGDRVIKGQALFEDKKIPA